MSQEEDSSSVITMADGGTLEDREQARFSVDCAVTINSEHNFYAGFAQNISAGGIFIATHIVHPVGTKFDLSLHLGAVIGLVRGVGEVRWIRAVDRDGDEPAGLGIRFTQLQDDGADRVRRFLEQRAPMVVGPSKAPPQSMPPNQGA